MTLAQKLKDLEIDPPSQEIFSMSHGELRQRFSYLNGSVDSSRLIRNLIWQDRLLLQAGLLEPVRGNIRSYWYARVKPVLGRARAKDFDDKYNLMISWLRDLVVDHQLISYSDFGFVDESAGQRKLGTDNAHIWCVAEKTGHLELLEQFHQLYGVTIYALGGQPSALGSENFVSMLRQAGLGKADCVMVSIVDFDPAGLSIIESFMHHLTRLGFEGQLRHISLIHPAHLTEDQIKLNRYPLSRSNRQRTMNADWAFRTGGLTAYGYSEHYGLEADAMSWQQIEELFERQITPYLTTPLEALKRRRLDMELLEVLKATLLSRLFG